MKGLLGAGKLGIKAIRAIRDERPLLDQLPDMAVPGWLTPPARAAWAVPRKASDRWVEVQITCEGCLWLDRAYHAIPRLVGATALMEAWFTWDDDEQQRLVVHLGEQTVGTLSATATTTCRAMMQAASDRDESPYTRARLTPRSTD